MNIASKSTIFSEKLQLILGFSWMLVIIMGFVQPLWGSGTHVQLMSTYGGTFNRVMVQGNYAYLSGTSQMAILDISTPSRMVLTFSTTVLSGVNYVYAYQDKAFMATASTLRVYDVTNPYSTSLSTTLMGVGSIKNMAAQGKYLYAVCGTGGLKVFDISSASNVHIVDGIGVVNGGSMNGIALTKGYAYVANGNAGLHIIDLSTPDSPTSLATIALTGTASKVAVHGNYAYIACGSSGLRIVNITDPTNAYYVAYYSMSGGVAEDVDINGIYAYIAFGNSGLFMLNVSNLNNISIDGYSQSNGYGDGIAHNDNMMFFANQSGGLQAIRHTILPYSLPSPQFYAIPTTGITPFTVNFYDISSAFPSNWYWDFGDGGSAWGMNVSHIYTFPGSYAVRLWVSNYTGTTSMYTTNYITVANDTGSVPIRMNVSNLVAVPGYGCANLSWANPFPLTFAAVAISYRTDRYPSYPTDGNLVYWYNGEQCSIGNLVNGQKYYFGLFGQDTGVNFAPGVFASIIPNSLHNIDDFTLTEPSPGISSITWTNPNMTNSYSASILVRRSDRVPTGPADGYNASDGTWFRYWYNGQTFGEAGLTPGNPYYYMIYANDPNMNFSPGIGGLIISGSTTINNVTRFNTISKYHKISFNWVNPTTNNFIFSMLVRRTDRYPTGPTDGTLIFWGNGTTCTDTTGVDGQSYYYAHYAVDYNLKTSPGLFACNQAGNNDNVSILQDSPHDSYIVLNWNNPNRNDNSSTLITRRLDRMPYEPADINGPYHVVNGNTYTDINLTNGTKYYYSVFAMDSNGNYSPGVGLCSFPSTDSLNNSIAKDISNPVNLKSLDTGLSNSIDLPSGWMAPMGDFSIANAVEFWGANDHIDWSSGAMVLGGTNTKLTLKNRIRTGSYRIKITYNSLSDIKLTPVFLVYPDEVSDTITHVILPQDTQLDKENNNSVITCNLKGEGDSAQLQLILSNPFHQNIRIKSIQLIQNSPIRGVVKHSEASCLE